MADTGKQSPLGVNVLGSMLAGHNINSPDTNTLHINPVAESYFGVSKNNNLYSPGSIVNNTCLFWLTYALENAWYRSPMGSTASRVSNATYDDLLNIGQSRIPALGNSKPPTYQIDDPTGVWQSLNGAANTGFAIPGNQDHGQQASWMPWNSSNSSNNEVTKWGWVRAMALQAYNEFWYNAEVNGSSIDANPSYKDFTSFFLQADGFVKYSNQAIFSIQNSQTFLQGTFSNQNDLISADVSGVSLSARAFGQDLINLGRAIDLSLISTFGLPSSLLKILQNNNALTGPLVVSLLTAGISQTDIQDIASGVITATIEQEQQIYGAYLIIKSTDLETILATLNCKTKDITSLADLLSVKKLFPISFRTLTVPIYNTNPGPTNSKTYYLLFINDQLNPQLVAPKVVEAIGTIGPAITPPPPVRVEPPVPVVVPPVVVEPVVVQPPIQPPPDTIVIPQPPSIPAPDPVPQVGGGGGCVALESYIPFIETDKKHNGRDVKLAWMLESDMKISLGTDDLQITTGYVHNTLNDYQPCLRIRTADGITLVCSTTARILTKEEGYRPATDILGKRVAVMRNGRAWYDEVIGLEDVGMRFVRVIDAGGNGFWAGERVDSYILHHNVIVNNDTNEIDKN